MHANNKRGDFSVELLFVVLILVVGIALALLLFNYKLPSSGEALYKKTSDNLKKGVYVPSLVVPEETNKNLETVKVLKENVTLTSFTDKSGFAEHSTEDLKLYCVHSKLVYIKIPKNVTVEYISFNITNKKRKSE
ncbi:MAG: hypothetical protein GWP09_02615 [Nitrospiraceae bacterium]|nr:hypothetical protein [Nitrospiraceae bacterium]